MSEVPVELTAVLASFPPVLQEPIKESSPKKPKKDGGKGKKREIEEEPREVPGTPSKKTSTSKEAWVLPPMPLPLPGLLPHLLVPLPLPRALLPAPSSSRKVKDAGVQKTVRCSSDWIEVRKKQLLAIPASSWLPLR